MIYIKSFAFCKDNYEHLLMPYAKNVFLIIDLLDEIFNFFNVRFMQGYPRLVIKYISIGKIFDVDKISSKN